MNVWLTRHRREFSIAKMALLSFSLITKRVRHVSISAFVFKIKCKVFLDTTIQKMFFKKSKTINFRGDLTDVSALKWSPSVILFLPKYQLGHLKNYWLLLSNSMFIGSTYPKNWKQHHWSPSNQWAHFPDGTLSFWDDSIFSAGFTFTKDLFLLQVNNCRKCSKFSMFFFYTVIKISF